jgi:hypothetical protein
LTVASADLTITKTHAGNFTNGQTGATYTITVSNVGFGPTVGTVTVTDTLPNVPNTLVPTAMSGTGWTCNLATLICTRSDALAAGASYPAITLTVNVPVSIQSSVTNMATVSGGGDSNPSNNTATDATTINGLLSITPGTSAATVKQGQLGTFSFNVIAAVPGTVSLGCSGLPLGATWSFNPTTPSSNGTTAETLTVTTTAPSVLGMNQPQLPLGQQPLYVAMAMSLPTFGLLFVGIGRGRGKKGKAARLVILGVVMLITLLALTGCGGHPRSLFGGNGNGGTPAGTFPITVTASSGNASAQTTVTLTVTP